MIKDNKILFILHYPPPIHGAAVVGQQIRDSKIINNSFTCKYINLSTSVSIDEIGNSGIIKLWRFLIINLKVFWALILFRPKLVYLTLTAQGTGFYKDSIVVFLVKLFQIKLIFHFHNKGVVLKQNKKWDNWLYTKVFNNTKSILLSKYLYYDIKKYVKKEDVFFCPNGIEAIDIKVIKKDNLKPQILFLSNLIETKGLYVLLEACKLLVEKNISFICNIVGGEGDISALALNKKIKAFHLQDKVFYLGKKYGKEKDTIFKQTDIFAFPTYFETFGLVNLEAMQYSLPIISTKEGGIPDMVKNGENGFLIEPQNPQQLAQKIEQLINDKELRIKMGAKGKVIFEKSFTEDIFENRLKDILLECHPSTFLRQAQDRLLRMTRKSLFT